MDHEFDMQKRKKGDVVLLDLAGSLTVGANETTFKDAVNELISRKHNRIVVNLENVEFMDSSGIAVLIEGLKWSRERSIPFILTHLTPSVQMVMELAHLEGFFTIAENLDDALALITQRC